MQNLKLGDRELVTRLTWNSKTKDQGVVTRLTRKLGMKQLCLVQLGGWKLKGKEVPHLTQNLKTWICQIRSELGTRNLDRAGISTHGRAEPGTFNTESSIPDPETWSR